MHGTSVTSCLGFGFAKTYWQAMLFRVMGGALNGNIGVMRTMISEIVQEKKLVPRLHVENNTDHKNQISIKGIPALSHVLQHRRYHRTSVGRSSRGPSCKLPEHFRECSMVEEVSLCTAESCERLLSFLCFIGCLLRSLRGMYWKS